MKKILLEDALILSFAKGARWLVHVLPLRVSLMIGRGVGSCLYHFTKRKKIAYQNIRAAFAKEKTRSEMKRIARLSIQNLVMSIVELLRFPDLDNRYIAEHVRLIGTEKLKPYLDRGQGLIFLTAHFGNWELLNVASSLTGYPMVALARVQKHPRSDEFLNGLRTSKGNQVIMKGMPIREILRSLKKGKIVGMLSDQDGGKNGTFVRFFGRMSSTPSGVATFSLRTGAPIFPVFNFRRHGYHHRVEVEGPLRNPSDTTPPAEAERILLQQFADLLESKIRKAPDQWLWAHRRWKSTPDRFVLVLSDGRAGHLNQSLAVLEAIKLERKNRGFGPENLNAIVVEVRFKNRRIENAFKLFCVLSRGRIPFKHWVLKTVLTRASYEALMKSYADIVISCGTSLLGVNLIIKHENQAKSVVVMKPSFPAKRFDLVLVPRHDRIKPAKNVFVTELALSLVVSDQLQANARIVSQELGLPDNQKRIGLLVGGDTDRMKLSKRIFEDLLGQVDRYAADTGSCVLATSSRRTPLWADELLKRKLNDKKRCPFLVIANEFNRVGTVGAILGLSDVIVVSGESMSMVSEAVASGKPVIVFMPSETAHLKPKHRRFLDALVLRKRIAVPDTGQVYESLGCHLGKSGHVLPPASADREVLSQAVKRVA